MNDAPHSELLRWIPALPLIAALIHGGWLALFTDWVLAFEATSLLLLSAMIGAVVLAKRKVD